MRAWTHTCVYILFIWLVCVANRDSSVFGLRIKRQGSSGSGDEGSSSMFHSSSRFQNNPQKIRLPAKTDNQQEDKIPTPVRQAPVRNRPDNKRRKKPQTPKSAKNGSVSAQNSRTRLSPTRNTSSQQFSEVDSVLIHNIIIQAVRNVRVEDRSIELRHELGIDKTANQFETMEPTLFSESPFDMAPLSRHSRIINWIGTILRDFGLTFPMSGILKHPTAVENNIKCPYVPPTCDFNAKYRTIDGSCNNMRNPLQGAAFTPMARELDPVYANDPFGKVDLPRSRGKVGDLPSARLVSTEIHSDRGSDERSTRWSMQLTFWGQMIAHDLTDRAPGKGHNGAAMACCNERIKTRFCFSIPVPKNDSFRDEGRDCLSFTRTAEVTDIDCKLGRREQLNQASSYLDAGFIYGVETSKTNLLRLGEKGLLATSMNGHLPIIPHPNKKASFQGFSFFATGDDRVNENIGLMGIETVWVREHNRIAEILSGLNPHWDDETTFQETKRIVTAIVQHITYNEYLPQIVGENAMDFYKIRPLKDGYFKGYDPSIDASVSNAFASAVYRFGHSMIRSTFSLMDKSFNYTDNSLLQLKDTFFTSITYLEHEHRFMRGTMMDQSEPCDRMLNHDLLNNLHQTRTGNGRDLASLNIQRGRDHGLPSYAAFRRLCNLSTSNEFTNATEGFTDHPAETVERFKQVYSHPDDVDLFTGGIAETPLGDAAVGPLFSAMIARQFQKLRYGDRYFYDSESQPVPFSREQLEEIRKVTYSSILCYNLHFNSIQPEAFLLTSGTKNAKVPCSSISGMNLRPWKQQ